MTDVLLTTIADLLGLGLVLAAFAHAVRMVVRVFSAEGEASRETRVIQPQSTLAQKQALRAVLYDCTPQEHERIIADIERQMRDPE